jgi:ferrochelatase
MAKTHVWLLALGSPESEAGLQPWLNAVLRDPGMLPLPMVWLHTLVAWWWCRRHLGTYRNMLLQLGGPGPEHEQIPKLARELERILGPRYRCEIVFRHRGADERHAAAGIGTGDQVVLFPLHPEIHAGAVRGAIADARAALRTKKVRIAQIEGWFSEPGYLDALAASVRSVLLSNPATRQGVLVLARGLTRRHASSGDPYPRQVEQTVQFLRGRLGQHLSIELAFGPAHGPGSRHGPSPAEALDRLHAAGLREVVVLPLGAATSAFSSQLGVDQEVRPAATARAMQFRLADPPAHQPGFARSLADIIRQVEVEAGFGVPEEEVREEVEEVLRAQGHRVLPLSCAARERLERHP